MSGAFLTGARARAYAGALAVAGAAILVLLVVTSQGGMDVLGRPVGTDFASFWTASRLALQGGGAAAYDVAAHRAAQGAAFPGVPSSGVAGRAGEYFAFFYPPPFLLLCLWLGLLPYLAAWAAWLAAGFALLWVGVRRLLPGVWPWPWAFVALAGFPGVLQNAVHGQNGFLSAACFGGAAVLGGRRSGWARFGAGACLGLLVFKPHLLLAAPVVLLAGRRWAVIAGGVCSGVGLCLLSWAVLGTGAWVGFLDGASLARATLEQGLVGPEKMQSGFAAVRLLGGGLVAAYGVQAAVTVVVLGVMGAVAARRPGVRAEVVVLTMGAMLCSPFLLDYDLVCLAVPLAWVLAEAQQSGFRRGEVAVLVAAYALPLLSRQVATYAGVPIGPLVLLGLLWVVVGQCGAWRRVGSSAAL